MINIIDSPMGSGKTTWAINKMKSGFNSRYIFITPYLSEIDRIVKDCSQNYFNRFEEPNVKRGKGSKFNNLKQLITENRNIASTHALFKYSNMEIKELLEHKNYTLILDEVFDVVTIYNDLSNSDFQLLKEQQMISIDNDGLIVWNEKELDYNGKFNYIKTLCLNKNLYVYGNNIFIWNFPCEIFKAFKNVYILTYMFGCQLQRYYFDMNKVDYKYYSIVHTDNNYNIVPKVNDDEDVKFINKIKPLINIYEGNLNTIGDNYKNKNPLCKGWYVKAKKTPEQPQLIKLKNNLYNYFNNVVNANSDTVLWTTFEKFKSSLKGKGYTKGFVYCNIRATNDYRKTSNLAYLINYFTNPIIEKYFYLKGIHIDNDMIALTVLIQWIWRSQIRDDKPINIYIPSERMRTILIKWLNNEYKYIYNE